MQIKVKHVHTVTKKLAYGGYAAYGYAWRGGPRVASGRGNTKGAAKAALSEYLATIEGIAKLAAVNETKAAAMASNRPSVAFIQGIVIRFIESPEYRNLKKRTRSDYLSHLGEFSEEFGSWRTALFEDPRIAQDLSEWRDDHPSPRQGDMRIQVVGALFSWARSRGITGARPTEPVRKIYKSDRADKIWSDEDLSKLLDNCPPSLSLAVQLAVNTGLRQGDLIKLPWSAVSDICIRHQTSKRGKEVVIPLTKELRELISAIPRISPIVLTSRSKRPWTASGLRSSFDRAKKRAGFTTEHDLRWHDFRGTAVTHLRKSGLTVRDLALIFGWSEERLERILSRYVSEKEMVRDMLERMSDEQIGKLNRKPHEGDND